MGRSIEQQEVEIKTEEAELGGTLTIPAGANGLVVFAHGSGSSRHSPRNRFVAETLNRAGLATLLFDLLTAEEEGLDDRTGELRFNIGFLASRLLEVGEWVNRRADASSLAIGFFGSSTGGGAALVAAAERPDRCAAVVSRGGRPDMAEAALPKVQAPTLLIVGGNDGPVIEMNRSAMEQMNCEVSLEIVPGATHLFQEPGALERVAEMAADWFSEHLAGQMRKAG